MNDKTLGKNTSSKKQISTAARSDRLSKELINTSTYGLEYVIDEIYEEKARNKEITQDSTIDWFGLSDLTVE